MLTGCRCGQRLGLSNELYGSSESRSVQVRARASEAARIYRDRQNPIMMLIDGWLVTTYN